MTNEITRTEKPGRLEKIGKKVVNVMTKPLSLRTCQIASSAGLVYTMAGVYGGIFLGSSSLIGLGVSGLSYTAYLVGRAIEEHGL